MLCGIIIHIITLSYPDIQLCSTFLCACVYASTISLITSHDKICMLIIIMIGSLIVVIHVLYITITLKIGKIFTYVNKCKEFLQSYH